MTPLPLAFFSNTGWLEHPDYPHAQWQEAVAGGQTQQGYMAWVVASHERDGVAYRLVDGALEEVEAQPNLEDAFPTEDWMAEVANLDTRRGYWAWAAHMAEQQGDEEEESTTS